MRFHVLPLLLAMVCATPVGAASCRDGQSLSGGAFDYFCQSHTAGAVAFNESLDDWEGDWQDMFDRDWTAFEAANARQIDATATASSKGAAARLGDGTWRTGTRIWLRADATHTDERGSPRATDSDTQNLLIGWSRPLGPDAGISYALGYGHIRSEQFDAFGGGLTKGDVLKTRLGYVRRLGTGLIIDTSLHYDRSWNRHDRVGFYDTYDMHQIGLGLGLNGQRIWSPQLRTTWRLGYAASRTIREASVDSAGVAMGRAVSDFQRISIAGQVRHSRAEGRVETYLGAKLNLALQDDTVAALDRAGPWLDLSFGLHGTLQDGSKLTAGLSYGGIGVSGLETYTLAVAYEARF